LEPHFQERDEAGAPMNLSAGQRRIFAIAWIAYAGFYLCRKNLSVVLPLLNNVTLGRPAASFKSSTFGEEATLRQQRTTRNIQLSTRLSF
jgi:sugar phosphate permease